MKLIHDLSLDELKRELEQLIEKMPRFRAGQVFDWITNYTPFDEMTNIPQDLRNLLKEHFLDIPVTIEKELISKDGTRKYLLALPDGNVVEAVLMSYNMETQYAYQHKLVAEWVVLFVQLALMVLQEI